MTFNPRDLPFRPAHPNLQPPESGAPVGPAQELKAESILLEEFGYAGVVAYQAREDAGALINLYLLATGALATGLGVLANAYAGTARPTISIVGISALSIYAILSFAFFARFLGLEEEYREGLQAMGVIKEFYIQRLRRTMPEIELAFRWRLRRPSLSATLAGGSPLIAWAIALLSGLSAAGIVGESRQLYSIIANVRVPYTPEPALVLSAPYLWEIAAALLVVAIHIAYYLLAVRRRRASAEEDATEQSARIERAFAGQ